MQKIYFVVCLFWILGACERPSNKNGLIFPNSLLELYRQRPELRKKILTAIWTNLRLHLAKAAPTMTKRKALALDKKKILWTGPKWTEIHLNAKIDRRKLALKALANPKFRIRLVNYIYKQIKDNPIEFLKHINSPILGSGSFRPIPIDIGLKESVPMASTMEINDSPVLFQFPTYYDYDYNR